MISESLAPGSVLQNLSFDLDQTEGETQKQSHDSNDTITSELSGLRFRISELEAELSSTQSQLYSHSSLQGQFESN